MGQHYGACPILLKSNNPADCSFPSRQRKPAAIFLWALKVGQEYTQERFLPLDKPIDESDFRINRQAQMPPLLHGP